MSDWLIEPDDMACGYYALDPDALSFEEMTDIALALSEKETSRAEVFGCSGMSNQATTNRAPTKIYEPMEDTTPGHMGEDWHYSRETHQKLLDFHKNTTRFPRESIRAANVNLRRLLEMLEEELKKKGFCSRIEYTGSVYEGVKVDTQDLEYDVMIIMTRTPKEEIKFEPIKGRSGYFMLRPVAKASSSLKMYMDEDEKYVLPHKVVHKLHSLVLKILTSRKGKFKDVLTCKLHGPALQLDVRKQGTRELWYSVDIVPTIEIPRANKMFVAKGFLSPSDDEFVSQERAWRRSYSVLEKNTIKNIDSGNECRKQTLRILKAIRDKESSLAYLHSYIYKTLILSHRTSRDWGQDFLGSCVMAMLVELYNALCNKHLPHAFDAHINILSDFTCESLKNSAARVRQLLKSKRAFYSLVEAQ